MYDLPEERIAQTPVEPRDHSRLMVLHRDTHEIEHRHFYDVIDYLNPGDCLVINETKVIPARLYGERPTGGACEVLLLKQVGPKKWETLVRPGKKLKPGAEVIFGDGRLKCRVLETTDAGGRIVEFECEGTFEAALDELGEMPLPPYIHEKLQDRDRYQTVYAKQDGSAAAPTAGLHFTPELLERMENIEDHEMHTEYFEVTEDAARRINAARERGGRVIAVGTTSVRTLESAAENGRVRAMRGDTNIFIKPGYQYQMVDALITNFHLPGSTLVMLVSALYDRERILDAYRVAVEEQYRFFSFGDAMLIL